MRNRIIRCSSFIAISLIVCILSTTISASAKSTDWKKIDSNLWRREPKNSIYAMEELLIEGNNLLSPHYYTQEYGGKWGSALICSWKMNETYDSLRIVTAKGDKVYVQLTGETGKALLYCVNLDTLKKKRVSKNFRMMESTKKYFYASTCTTTDTSSYPMYVWKLDGGSMKRGKYLGKYIFETIVVGKNIYYGKYKSSSQKKVTIYRANLDGSNPKKLFSVKGKGEYVQSLLSSADKKEIKVSTSINGEYVTYVYNIKTKHISKLK